MKSKQIYYQLYSYMLNTAYISSRNAASFILFTRIFCEDQSGGPVLWSSCALRYFSAMQSVGETLFVLPLICECPIDIVIARVAGCSGQGRVRSESARKFS